MAALPEDFVVFSGEDSTALALIALGGRGLISVASNEIPREMTALVAAALEGRDDEARKLQRKYLPLMEMNFWDSSPGPAKAALSAMGRCGDTVRLPLVAVRDDMRAPHREAARGPEAPAEEGRRGALNGARSTANAAPTGGSRPGHRRSFADPDAQPADALRQLVEDLKAGLNDGSIRAAEKEGDRWVAAALGQAGDPSRLPRRRDRARRPPDPAFRSSTRTRFRFRT